MKDPIWMCKVTCKKFIFFGKEDFVLVGILSIQSLCKVGKHSAARCLRINFATKQRKRKGFTAIYSTKHSSAMADKHTQAVN